MYHSLIFQSGNIKINTWDNWHLIPTQRPVLPMPTPQYNFVDIPGSDGSMDLTDYLVGRPTYSDRQGTFDFYVVNDYGDWASRRDEIAAFLNGSKMKLYLEDDPKYYYEGRFMLKEWRADPNYSHVVIEYRVKPYKYLSNGREAGL